jgi:5-methylcytosine-specific restriction endonuclease McrA
MCQERLLANYEVDHMIPLWVGGSNRPHNLQALCRNCHGEKTFDDLIRWGSHFTQKT